MEKPRLRACPLLSMARGMQEAAGQEQGDGGDCTCAGLSRVLLQGMGLGAISPVWS